MIIKIRLKEIMEKKGLTYRELAKLAFNDERRAASLHRIASGQTDVRLSMVSRLLDALGCKLSDLLAQEKGK